MLGSCPRQKDESVIAFLEIDSHCAGSSQSEHKLVLAFCGTFIGWSDPKRKLHRFGTAPALSKKVRYEDINKYYNTMPASCRGTGYQNAHLGLDLGSARGLAAHFSISPAPNSPSDITLTQVLQTRRLDDEQLHLFLYRQDDVLLEVSA